MPRAPATRDDLAGFMRDIDIRLQRAERHTHNLPYPAPPGPAPAPPFLPPPVVVPACDYFDDFERADGPVGADWAIGPSTNGAGVSSPQLATIDSGAAIGPAVGNFTSMRWATSTPLAHQSVEVVLANWVADSSFYMRVGLYNYLGGGPDGNARCYAEFRTSYSTPNLDVSGGSFLTDNTWSDGAYVDLSPWTGGTGPVTFRLDSYGPAGRQVVTLNGTVVLDFTDPPTSAAPSGSGQGYMVTWVSHGGRTTSPRILSVCFNAGGA